MNTKLIVALIVVGVLAITVVGLVSAQVLTATPTPNGTTGNGASTGGFLGWMGRCFGLRGTTQSSTSQPENITVYNPNTNTTTTYQGYGTGGCMNRVFP